MAGVGDGLEGEGSAPHQQQNEDDLSEVDCASAAVAKRGNVAEMDKSGDGNRGLESSNTEVR